MGAEIERPGPAYAITPELAWRLLAEIRGLRECFVADEVDGQLAAAEGNLTRAAVDQVESAARVTWARTWPALDSLVVGITARIGGAA